MIRRRSTEIAQQIYPRSIREADIDHGHIGLGPCKFRQCRAHAADQNGGAARKRCGSHRF
jgi:hypothetical protein